jgi:hypothetical protein
MPYGIFKEIKVKCGFCDDIVVSTSDEEWTECSCGSTKVRGRHSFKQINGKKYTDLSTYNYDSLPPHQD